VPTMFDTTIVSYPAHRQNDMQNDNERKHNSVSLSGVIILKL